MVDFTQKTIKGFKQAHRSDYKGRLSNDTDRALFDTMLNWYQACPHLLGIQCREFRMVQYVGGFTYTWYD